MIAVHRCAWLWAAKYDHGGIFAISRSNLVINLSGPLVGTAGGTIQNLIIGS
ncbi:MAG: hypothetical protein JOY83_23655 [Alphaproteobacteria bacterium]|nr:hypothetical protein [Alphaproteobacteria bacterium]